MNCENNFEADVGNGFSKVDAAKYVIFVGIILIIIPMNHSI